MNAYDYGIKITHASMNADDYGIENAKLRFELTVLKRTLEAAVAELRILRAVINYAQPEITHDT